MVTHDADEALFLGDPVVRMTDGPAATIGDILKVNFSRPRCSTIRHAAAVNIC